jgi:hypothetical protein
MKGAFQHGAGVGGHAFKITQLGKWLGTVYSGGRRQAWMLEGIPRQLQTLPIATYDVLRTN